MKIIAVRSMLRAAFIILAMVVAVSVHAARAASDSEAARSIFNKWSDTVITVKATVKMSMIVGGSEASKEESEIEALATVIDPSGLCVLSFSCIDPSAMFDGILKKLKASGAGPQVDIDTSISGLTMVMPDGREIPATMLLKDPDLDLAFVGPTDKLEEPVAALDISGECEKDVLDTLCILGRLDKSSGRKPMVTLQRIEAVIDIPRKCYVVDEGALLAALGAPVFSVDGKLVGFSLFKISKSNDTTKRLNFGSGSMSSMGIMPVVLPAVEVSDGYKQALETMTGKEAKESE